MTRRARTAIVAALAAVLSLVAMGTAQAQYLEGCTAGISDTTPNPGQTITVTGGQLAPGTTVTIDFESPDPVRLATLQVGDDGTFVTDVTIPADAVPGPHQLIVDPCQTIDINVPGPGAAPRAPRAGGGLARTGGDSFPLVRAAILLILLGAGITLTARKRRSSRSGDHVPA